MRVPFYDKHGNFLFEQDVVPLHPYWEVVHLSNQTQQLDGSVVCKRRRFGLERTLVLSPTGVEEHVSYREVTMNVSPNEVKPKKKYTFTVRRKEVP